MSSRTATFLARCAERRPDLVETAVLLPRRLRVGLQVDLKRHHAAKLRDEVRRSVHGGPYEIALKAALAFPPLLGPARGLAVLVDEAHARGGRQAQAGGRCSISKDMRTEKPSSTPRSLRLRKRSKQKEGLEPELVSGGGTGSYYFESCSGVYNELQCGSYAFMDADYGRILDRNGERIDKGEWENALFILTSVMSHAKPDKAICDAGLKAQSVDSGLPFVYGRVDVKYVKCSDEHGVIDDPKGVLKINDKLRLVPGHCDPTCNVHDWYVGIRKGKVETLWPISARGKAY
jgi:D-serine deaminase-like pyridoxal phosphate-dependent protein